MAGASLFALIDDIAAVLDDVAVMSKVAAKKTVGVIGDDLALNADQVSGKDIRAERELPIVFAVAKGAVINKLILIPLALVLSLYFPSAITLLLVCGGAYLCFEGVEKLLHQFILKAEHHENKTNLSEKDKIRGAIRTDFILSAEIIIIALGELQQSEPLVKISALIVVGLAITFFVYGVVALIVKLDDIGLWLLRKHNFTAQKVGAFLIWLMPWIMKSLSIIGTLAMFFVGGSIFSHNLAPLHHFIEGLALPSWASLFADFAAGIVAGSLLCLIVLPIGALLARKEKA